MSALPQLADAWLQAKQDEAAAVKRRRELEDQMAALMAIDATRDGTTTVTPDGYKVTVENRINKKIDSDKLQMLAAEAGLSEHLSSLFRWKAEINAKAWKAAADAVTEPLLDAITSTPGRPSFTITKE